MSGHLQGGAQQHALSNNPLPTTAWPPAAHNSRNGSSRRLTHAEAHAFLSSFLAAADVDAAYRPDSRVTEQGVVASAGGGGAGSGNRSEGVVDLRLTYLGNILQGMEGKVKIGVGMGMGMGIEGDGSGKKRKRGYENGNGNGNSGGEGEGEGEGDRVGYASDASGWQDPKAFAEWAQQNGDEGDDDDGDVMMNNQERDPTAGEMVPLEDEGVDMEVEVEEEIKEKNEEETTTTTTTIPRQKKMKSEKDKEKRKDDKKARKKADKAEREKRRREEKTGS